MPQAIYEYKCTECNQRYTSHTRGDRLDLPHSSPPNACLNCQHVGELVRVFSVSIHKPMMAHFNHTTKTEISDMKQFNRQLRKMSDEASEYTGQEHDYRPIDPLDTKALGVTEEGLDYTNRDRVAKGLKPIDLSLIS